jgi:cyclic pyranopterin phosphate synthase
MHRLGPMSQLRAYSNKSDDFSHVDSTGSARMVNISDKKETSRTAVARGTIRFSNPLVSTQIKNNELKKGDVLSVARIAGIMAVKSTANIIPLCHPIMVTKISNELFVNEDSVDVECTVGCVGKTGVEMEAIVGAMATLTTVYDMCKAIDKHMVITNVHVKKKKGGKNDFEVNM